MTGVLPTDVKATAAGVAARFDEVVDATMRRLWENPALAEWTRPETRAPAEAIAARSLRREIEALERWELPDACPLEDLAAARAAVHFGAPVTVPLACYRAGQAALWAAWQDAAEAAEPDATRRRALLDAGSDFLFAYVDRCAGWVEAEHALARDRALRSTEQQRMRAVMAALEGAVVDLGLRREVVGVVAWGAEPEMATRGAALAVSPVPDHVWAWFETPARPPVAPPDTWVAIGDPGDFRSTHAEAAEAARVARLRPPGTTRYANVGLEALVLLDEARARVYAERELGPLAAGGEREATQRATLAAYFAAAHNAASAAATLGVHERTVTNRLRAVEARLGVSVAERRAELEVALRLRALFDD